MTTTEAQQLRDDMLKRTRDEYARLEAVLDSLTEAEMTTPGTTPGWSVKDHLAHLEWWMRRVILVLNGEPDPIAKVPGDQEDEENVNANVRAWNADRSLADVRAGFEQTHQDMLHLIETVPDDVLVAKQGWISGNADSHYDEHRTMFEAWRESQRANANA